MARKLPLFILTWVLGLLPVSSFVMAMEVVGLYEAEVPVTGRGQTQQVAGLRTALGTVLRKATGDPQIVGRSGVDRILDRAPKLVQQYRYQELEGAAASEDSPSWTLWAQFDERAVNELLRDLNLPIWGKVRPTTLLWLAVEDSQERRLMAADSDKQVEEVIRQITAERGIPFLLPMMDLQDQMRLEYSDVWGDFAAEVKAASARYAADAILVGRIEKTGVERWQGRWSLYQGENPAHWSDRTADFEASLRAGLQEAADALASRFAPIPGTVEETTILIHIRGIDTLEKYARISGHLEALGLLKEVQPVVVRSDEILFQGRVRGELHNLEQALALGGLRPAVPPEPELGADTSQSAVLSGPSTTSEAREIYFQLGP